MKRENSFSINSRFFVQVLMLIPLLIFVSCSGGSDKTATSPSVSQGSDFSIDLSAVNPGSTHKIVDMALVHFDPAYDTLEISSMRTAEAHMNLTGFLNHPNCTGGNCLKWYVAGFDPVKRIWTIDAHLQNPTIFNAYDLRIQFMDLPGDPYDTVNPTPEWQIVNPDSYTNIHDTDPPWTTSAQWMNPFIAFEKQRFDRKFPADPDGSGPKIYSDVEQFKVHIPANAPGGSMVLVLDVSWPGHCYDPYHILDWNQVEKLPPGTGLGTSRIEVVVADWQDDVSEVSVYLPEILTNEKEAMNIYPNTGPNKWPPDIIVTDGLNPTELAFLEKWGNFIDLTQNPPVSHIRKYYLDIDNELNAPEGIYDAIIIAQSNDLDMAGNDTLYHKFPFEVAKGGTGGSGGSKNVQIAFTRYDIEQGGAVNAELWTYTFIDGKFHKLFNGAKVGEVYSTELEVCISPNGDRIAFISDYNKTTGTLGNFKLYTGTINYIGNVPQTLNFANVTDVTASFSTYANARTPDFSQDNAFIAFSIDEFGHYDIYTTTSTAPFNAMRITTNVASDEAPNYDKNQPIGGGQYGIYFHSNRAGGGNYEIYWLNPASQESGSNQPIRKTFRPGFDGYPSSRYSDNSLLWTSDREGDMDIMLFNGTDVINLMAVLNENDPPETSNDSNPCWSPNGEIIAYHSDKSEYQFDIWRMNESGGNKSRVTFDQNLIEIDPFYAITHD